MAQPTDRSHQGSRTSPLKSLRELGRKVGGVARAELLERERQIQPHDVAVELRKQDAHPDADILMQAGSSRLAAAVVAVKDIGVSPAS